MSKLLAVRWGPSSHSERGTGVPGSRLASDVHVLYGLGCLVHPLRDSVSFAAMVSRRSCSLACWISQPPQTLWPGPLARVEAEARAQGQGCAP